MSKVTGVVEKLHTVGTNNGGTAYNIVVDDVWYGCGFKSPGCNEGDTVSFSFTTRGNFKNVDMPSFKKEEGGAVTTPQARAQGPSARDVTIGYQSSRKDALTVIDTMLNNQLVKLPTKKESQMDAVLALVDVITNKFYTDLQAVVERGGIASDIEDENFG